MQAGEDVRYRGMIAADPNMILNVTVPETVQQQAKNWERGTRTLQVKAAHRSDLPVEDDTDGLSSSSEHETDDQSTPNSTKRETLSQVQKKAHYSGDPTTRDSPVAERPQCNSRTAHGEEDVPTSAACTSNNGDTENPFSVDVLPNSYVFRQFQYRYWQAVLDDSRSCPAHSEDHLNPEDPPCQRAGRPPPADGPSSRPQQLGTRRSFTNIHARHFTADSSVVESTSVLDDCVRPRYLTHRYGRPPHDLRSCSGPAPHGSNGRSVRCDGCWAGHDFQAADMGQDFPTARDNLLQPTAIQALLGRHPRGQTSTTARSGMRPRCRQWLGSRTTTELHARAVPEFGLQENVHAAHTCCNTSARRTSLREMDHVRKRPLAWFERRAQGRRPPEVDQSVSRPPISGSTAVEPRHHRTARPPACEGSKPDTKPDELLDLSVEETVDFFLNMTSPIEGTRPGAGHGVTTAVSLPAGGSGHRKGMSQDEYCQ